MRHVTAMAGEGEHRRLEAAVQLCERLLAQLYWVALALVADLPAALRRVALQ